MTSSVLPALLLERDRGDRPVAACFFIGPDEARGRCHFKIPAMKRHALRGGRVPEHEAVRAAHANIELAGKQRQAKRLRNPPPLEQLGLGPRLEYDARRGVDGSRDDELSLGLRSTDVRCLRGWLTTSSCVHGLSPSVSIPRQPRPTRRSVRPRAGGTSRSTSPLPPVGADRACRSARARSSRW